MTPSQSRAARGYLQWSQQELAASAGLSLSTIRDFETGKRELSRKFARRLWGLFAENGVLFVYGGNFNVVCFGNISDRPYDQPDRDFCIPFSIFLENIKDGYISP
jgi:transcriptional regulator with XRE-family HTH domain